MLLKQKEEDIILHYQKAQADKAGLEELLTRLEQAKGELIAAQERKQLLLGKEQMEAEFAREQKRMEEVRGRMLAMEEERDTCRRQSERMADIYKQGTALEKQEREIKQQLLNLAEQKKRLESYEGIKKNYERLTALLAETSERQRVLELERAQMEQRYLYEQAGMLADHLVTGEACPVCGSHDHPEPAAREVGAPTKEELEAKRAESEKLREEASELSKEAAMEKSTMQLLEEQSGQLGMAVRSIKECEQEEAGQNKKLAELLAEIEVLVTEQKRCMEAKDRLPDIEKKMAEEQKLLEFGQETLVRMQTNLQNTENEIKKLTLQISVENEEEAEAKLIVLKAEHTKKKESIAAAETAYYEWDNVRQSETAVLTQLLGQKTARAMKEQNERELYASALKNAGFDSEEDYEQQLWTKRSLRG